MRSSSHCGSARRCVNVTWVTVSLIKLRRVGVPAVHLLTISATARGSPMARPSAYVLSLVAAHERNLGSLVSSLASEAKLLTGAPLGSTPDVSIASPFSYTAR